MSVRIAILKDPRIDNDPHLTLKRDARSGLAWIENTHVGQGVSVHSNISATGSVAGMKDRGYWKRDDRTARSHGFIYNVDTFVCDPKNPLEVVVSEHCQCLGCRERREKEEVKKSS